MAKASSCLLEPVYLDANATVPLLPAARVALLEVLDGAFANPSSVHALGQRARAVVDGAREACAKALGCEPKELIFTSGGTESVALALHGVVRAACSSGRVWRSPGLTGMTGPKGVGGQAPRAHVVTTQVEHPAVLGACAQLEAEGVLVTRVGVDGEGLLDLVALEDALAVPGTVLCSVMAANNETGVLSPLREVAELCHRRSVPLHTDAVQLAGKAPIDLEELPVQLLSLTGHKLGGPRGAGLLFVRRGVQLEPLLAGGHQERGFRAGTEDAAAIAGLSAALAEADGPPFAEKLRTLETLRDELQAAVEAIPGARVVGGGAARIGNTLCATFEGCAGEELLVALDLRGISVSTGSACSSGTLEPSHVLRAMGLGEREARATVRFSLWRGNTRADIARVAGHLEDVVRECRR
jgi:cysteine desulfurase